MPAPETVKQLVEHFTRNLPSYQSGKFNEAQLRLEFLNPFFEALGWDVANSSGYAEAYKDVVVEPSLEVEGELKAPDYAFRIGGTRKFFVEAKKPAVNIHYDIYPAFQLRRYAWSAKLPLGILTDFEEFAVYDCRSKPNPSDQAATGRVNYLKFNEYIERWDEVAGIFSKDAVMKGSFDQYAQGVKGKHGTQEVDDAFLKEIEGWRELLARNLALRNPALSVPELNYAVQMTIDRIVFLRICEDRGIEPQEQLKALLGLDDIYGGLCALFRQADTRYNSGLFHFEKENGQSSSPDGLSLGLAIDDKALKDIISDLYFPCPYVFSVIPTDILGQVYERFLGKVIRLTAGHQAKVEEKPEVRKAGGVYYTPTYIVDYIVKNTVGKLLEDKTPKEAAELKIVDPACGSGSFLLGAYQYLLDWHKKWYTDNNPPGWAKGASPRIYQAQGGEWELTTAEKKRILLDNIHGVDIDPQAVEVTKLSLSLKVLEGESGESIGTQLGLFKERALPDLGRNIQCGNSLIGPDYYDGRQLALDMEGAEERSRVNAFDWQNAFPQVFARGGFDAVIGNPPYVRQESLGSQKEYFQKHYQTYQGTADLYTYFIEQGVRLLRPDGLFSYIVANKWMRANYGKPLRTWFKTQCIEEIVDFGDLRVFEQATTYPCILRIRAGKKPFSTFKSVKVETLEFNDLGDYIENNSISVNQAKLDDGGWSLSDENTSALFEKLKKRGVPLGDYVNGKIYRGILTGLNEAFVIDAQTRKQLIKEHPSSDEVIMPFLAGRDIKRYAEPKSDRFLILLPRGWTKKKSGEVRDAWGWFVKNFPAIANHLKPFEQAAQKRFDKGEYWWELRACGYYSEFKNPKLLLPDISLQGNFMLDNEGIYFCVNTAYIIPVKEKYLLGILNSRLITFIYRQLSSSYRGGYLRFIFQYLEKIPIHVIDNLNQDELSLSKKLEQLVNKMLDLQKKSTHIPQEEKALIREIEATDKQIDALVYELYRLTEEEIKIVENG